MSIASRITSIEEHIGNAYDSIKKFGVDTSVINRNIENIANVINDDIYNKLPKITQSGAGFTLSDVQNGQVDDFKMIGVDLQQNGTSTPDNPQEIKVVEGSQTITDKGKNLLKSYTETTEKYGITASYNQNTHVYTFNGTCTRDNITFILSNNKINFTKQVTKSITFWVGGSCTNSCDIRHFDSNYNSNVIYSIVNISSTNNKISKTSNYTFESPINYATIRFNNGSVANNLQIKVMVTDDDNTDYEPYYNPVSYNINLHGKNEFDGEYEDGYYNMNGTKPSTQDPYGRRSTNLNKIEPNTNYSISINNNIISETIRLFYYDASRKFISTESISNGTFTTPAECYYVSWHSSSLKQNYPDGIPNMMIEQGQTVTTYEDYYDYKLAKMPNTNYKNRIYRNDGNWYFEENVKNIVLDGSENWAKNSYSFYWSGDMFSNKPVSICSHFIDNGSSWTSSDENLRGKYTTTNAMQFKCMPLEDMTLNEFKTWLSTNNVDVWCQLDNPITTQITNTTLINQLEAISVHTGTNIITISNDNNVIPEIEITRLKELEKLS